MRAHRRLTGILTLAVTAVAGAAPAASATAPPGAPEPRPALVAPALTTTNAVPPVLALSTVEDLRTSMQGEAFAHASYTFFAAQADREKLPGTADLFRRNARTELWEHFAEEAALGNFIGSDESNLRHAIENETHEAHTMYPGFAAEARQDGDIEAAELFTEIAGDEDTHRKLFSQALRSEQGWVPAPPALDDVQVPAGLPKVISPRTMDNLRTALHGEALAHATYRLYARHAADHGNAALARLFDGLARIELREHFAGEAVLAGLVSDTRSNLRTAIGGERYEATVMYPAFAARADRAGDKEAAELFRDNAGDEAGHARAFELALRRLG